MISEKPDINNIRTVAIILLAILVVLAGYGYVMSNSRQVEEYNSYLEARNRAITELNYDFDKWDLALEKASSDRKFTYSEYVDMVNFANAHRERSDETVSELYEFKIFIIENELFLKFAGIDTSGDKERLTSDIENLNKNVAGMESTLEEMQGHVAIPANETRDTGRL